MTVYPSLSGILLLCIDMQPVFVRAIADGGEIQKRCALALAAANGLGLPIIFTEQVPNKLGGTASELRSLAPDAPVVPKQTFSALGENSLQEALRRPPAAEHLLLCGLETPVCIYQTAVAALAEGGRVTVLSDAIGARRSADAAACLDTLRHAGAHILPTETVFYALLQDVQHPFFKTFTSLVKSHA